MKRHLNAQSVTDVYFFGAMATHAWSIWQGASNRLHEVPCNAPSKINDFGLCTMDQNGIQYVLMSMYAHAAVSRLLAAIMF